tara:strand:- start:2628 stop:5105 length:2478 start_codon:yes stop_codon:yes gene_type:complete
MKKLSVLSVLILTLNFVFGQEIPISIVDRLNSVNFIFEGTVIHSEAYYNSNGTYIYTSNTVEISRILKGEIECGTIEIITYGGQVGGESVEVTHSLQLIEGSMGIFLCDETNAPLSIVDFYPETNVEKLEATFENQSFIRYWWDGQGINAADLWLNYDSLAAIYNATEAITGLSYIECTANPNSFFGNNPQNQNLIDEKEEIFPTYSKAAFDSLINYAKFKKENYSRVKSGRANDKVFYNLENFIISGGSQKYLEFDVTIKDDIGTKYLDLSAIRLEYDPVTFGTNIVSNSNILVTRGSLNSDPACYSDPVPSDQNSNTILIPALETVYSQCKAPILTSAQSIMHIKMKILDCSIPSGIELVDTATFFSPSMILDYSAYAEFPNDTFSTYYSELEHFQFEQVPSCVTTITSFEPHSLAGGIKDTLTIRGYQFGSQQGSGKVYFPNADDGGVSEVWIDQLDTILWSDTLIKVFVPSFDSGMVDTTATENLPAGTGHFKIVANDGSYDYSPDPLNIRYSVKNNSLKERYILAPWTVYNKAYVFHCDLGVANYDNGAMKDVIDKALRDWTCLTGINWYLSTDTNYVGAIGKDTLCLIQLSNNLDSTVLAKTTSYQATCNGAPFNHEFDIEINSKRIWNCDSTGTVSQGEIDLYSVILHELGHAHRLNHVIDTNKIMHFSIGSGKYRRDLEFDQSCDEGGNDVIQHSTDAINTIACVSAAQNISANPNPPCNHVTVSIEDINQDELEFIIFPNPVSSILNISISSEINENTQIVLMDVSGKIVKTFSKSILEGENKFELPIYEIASGVYILRIQSNSGVNLVNAKFIKQ